MRDVFVPADAGGDGRALAAHCAEAVAGWVRTVLRGAARATAAGGLADERAVDPGAHTTRQLLVTTRPDLEDRLWLPVIVAAADEVEGRRDGERCGDTRRDVRRGRLGWSGAAGVARVAARGAASRCALLINLS